MVNIRWRKSFEEMTVEWRGKGTDEGSKTFNLPSKRGTGLVFIATYLCVFIF